MRRIPILVLVLLVSLVCFAANDILIKRNSEKIEAIIQEVSDIEVKYKKASNPAGPTYIVKLSELATIVYANGEVQAIPESAQSAQPAQQPQQQQVQPQQQQAQPQQSQYNFNYSQQQQQKPPQQTQQQQTQPQQQSSGYNFNYAPVTKPAKEPKPKKERPKRTYEWENFILANYLYGQYQHHSVGVTYGRVKLGGWYVNAAIGVDPNFHYGYDYQGTEYDHHVYINGQWEYPFYTGKVSRNQVLLSAGAIIRMVIPLYWYGGIGGCYLTRTYELANGKWAMLSPAKMNYNGMNMVFETGLQGNIKGFTLSAGYLVMSDFVDHVQHELKVGIGYTFPDKKKQAKKAQPTKESK